jgi:hypothetical protein
MPGSSIPERRAAANRDRRLSSRLAAGAARCRAGGVFGARTLSLKHEPVP